jgi:hypothetical protein
MKLKILALATLLAPFWLAASASAQNPDHIKQLQLTNKCPYCDLSNANLKEFKLTNADLKGANLFGANLSNANLEGAILISSNLAGVNLSGANLSRAKIRGANLIEANLSNANLSNADLKQANLVGANLAGANLTATDLSAANLVGVDLSESDLSDTNFFGANLTGALGLPLPILPSSASVFESESDDVFRPPLGVPRNSRGTRGGYNPGPVGKPGQTESAGGRNREGIPVTQPQ